MTSSPKDDAGAAAVATGRRPVRMLESALVDQIAAGEVVERPASVVKELVENALDAQATSIRVETEQGGLARIVVSDDGLGMDRQDAVLALSRHATSKIGSLEELHVVRSLGFRGEALPSIASVSRFELRTRPHDALEGTEVRVEGGGALDVRLGAGSPGTTVRVDDLFFNVPARRKFLKRLETESAHVGETLLRVALARPSLRLSWLRDGRRARDWAPTGDPHQRAYQVFTGERLVSIEGERDGVRVRAVLGAPERARQGALRLHPSVNGRIVRDRALLRAVAFAYGDALPAGRFPIGAIWIELDPARVDVNVHPQKSEVRFADASVVFSAVTRILASGLGQRPFAARAPMGRSASAEPRHETRPYAPLEPASARVAEALAPSHAPAEASALAGAPASRGPLATRLLGELERRYLVCEAASGLVVIDRHAADERVLLARLALAHRDGEVASSRLLMPARVALDELEARTLAEKEPLLATLGLEARLFGEREALLVGIPVIARRASLERLLHRVLEALALGAPRPGVDPLDAALAAIACEAAIRPGEALSFDEQAALVRALDAAPPSSPTPHHARVFVHAIALDDLARRSEGS